jgi:hypothetical protein
MGAPEATRVFVYFNLHRKVWSVKALNGPRRGSVIHHANFVRVRDASFRVSEAGRQRVLREGRKNVHAGVVGTLEEVADARPAGVVYMGCTVTYNPRKAGTFVAKLGGLPVYGADHVTLDAADRSVIAWVVRP